MGVILFSDAKQKGNPEKLLAMTLLRFLSLSLLLFSTVITPSPSGERRLPRRLIPSSKT